MGGGVERSQLDVGSYLGVLRRRWKAVLFVQLLVVASALVASQLQTPLYQGKAKLLLEQRRSELLFDVASPEDSDPERRVATEIEVIKSEPVRAAVRDRLGEAPKVSVTQVGTSNILEVKARSTNRARAATIATGYANAYIEYRRAQAVRDLEEAGTKLEARVSDLQRQIDALSRAGDGAAGANATRDQLVSQQALYQQRLDELKVDVELKTGGAQLIAAASPPSSPVQPKPVRNGIMAAAVGLVLAVALALLLEYFDDSVKTTEDLERVAEVPTLGVIPSIDTWRSSTAPLVISVEEPASPAAEAYRSLRTGLQFVGIQRAPRTIQVTSGTPGEGKTSTASNLGVVTAKGGQTVVLVDCDLRRARLHEFFNLSNRLGFTSVLVGDVSLDEAVVRVEGVPGLALLTSGPLPPNPSELLASRQAAQLLVQLQDRYDVVIIDTPPVMPVTDALVVSAWVDATLLVVAAGITSGRDLQRPIELLRQVDAPLVGTVLNRVSPRLGYAYGYDYTYRNPEAKEGRGRPPVTEPRRRSSPPPPEGARDAVVAKTSGPVPDAGDRQ